MRPQKQKFGHDPKAGIFGDCFRTAIAVLLDLDRDDVPHFNDGAEFADGNCASRANAWLGERGLTLISIPYPGSLSLDDVLTTQANVNPGLNFLLAGTSRTGVNHNVIANGGAIVWDPSLTDAGIVGPCDDGMWWLDFIGRRV